MSENLCEPWSKSVLVPPTLAKIRKEANKKPLELHDAEQPRTLT